MKIFALYEYVYNGCDSWETIIDLYRNEDDAIEHLLREEATEHNEEYENWFIKELELH